MVREKNYGSSSLCWDLHVLKLKINSSNLKHIIIKVLRIWGKSQSKRSVKRSRGAWTEEVSVMEPKAFPETQSWIPHQTPLSSNSPLPGRPCELVHRNTDHRSKRQTKVCCMQIPWCKRHIKDIKASVKHRWCKYQETSKTREITDAAAERHCEKKRLEIGGKKKKSRDRSKLYKNIIRKRSISMGTILARCNTRNVPDFGPRGRHLSSALPAPALLLLAGDLGPFCLSSSAFSPPCHVVLHPSFNHLRCYKASMRQFKLLTARKYPGLEWKVWGRGMTWGFLHGCFSVGLSSDIRCPLSPASGTSWGMQVWWWAR